MQDKFEILDFIPMGAFVLDAQYRVLFWNKCLETWTNIPAEKLLSKNIKQHFPNLGHPKITSRLEGIFLGGPPIIFSAQLHRYIIPAFLPGERMRLQNTMVNAVRTDGGYLALFTLQDVTETSHRLEQYIAMRNQALSEVEERRKAEAEISEREAMYRSIFEKIRAVKMIIAPTNGDIVDANTAACYFYGYPYSQLLRLSFQDICPLPKDELLEQMQLAVREEKNFFELTHKLANGNLRQVEMHSAPIEVRGQTLLYSIIHDVTERKTAEAALRTSEKKFRLLFELAADMILVSEINGKILDANKLCCEKLGYTKQELLERTIFDLAPSTIAQVEARLEDLNKDIPISFETVALTSRGEMLPVEIQAKRIELSGRSAIISIGRDISERKKMETLREEVDRITRHDLKNPLSAVLGLPEVLLQSSNLDREQRHMIKVIQDAGYSMINMINQSLDLYKIEIGTYKLKPSAVDIPRLLEKILSEEREQLDSKKLRPHIVLDATENDQVQVLGERMLCYSMLSNLVKNAIEASPENERLQLLLKADKDVVTIQIHNQGAVPKEIREIFFKKYVTAGKKNGTGLGTYSAMLMAQVQNGNIEFTTDNTTGTTATITLPRAEKTPLPHA